MPFIFLHFPGPMRASLCVSLRAGAQAQAASSRACHTLQVSEVKAPICEGALLLVPCSSPQFRTGHRNSSLKQSFSLFRRRAGLLVGPSTSFPCHFRAGPWQLSGAPVLPEPTRNKAYKAHESTYAVSLRFVVSFRPCAPSSNAVCMMLKIVCRWSGYQSSKSFCLCCCISFAFDRFRALALGVFESWQNLTVFESLSESGSRVGTSRL